MDAQIIIPLEEYNRLKEIEKDSNELDDFQALKKDYEQMAGMSTKEHRKMIRFYETYKVISHKLAPLLENNQK